LTILSRRSRGALDNSAAKIVGVFDLRHEFWVRAVPYFVNE
jgi:hypothetical protein